MLDEAFTPAILTSNEYFPYGYGWIVELQIQLEFVTKKHGVPSEELILCDQGEHRAVRIQI
ncbi:hypothetical protein [Paenibacillus sp. JNUCC31]|uniref:hypothetical protein n=1 Tax=Paenibacillus sp. JNUCC-31 TaxID=2777983 RepID=UPI001E5AF97F|nr:hypothetical protein [Paenibacillus sp. JNUCC-31]